MMRVLHINHHCWYDCMLDIYDPWPVCCSQIDGSMELHGSGCRFNSFCMNRDSLGLFSFRRRTTCVKTCFVSDFKWSIDKWSIAFKCSLESVLRCFWNLIIGKLFHLSDDFEEVALEIMQNIEFLKTPGIEQKQKAHTSNCRNI